MSHSSQPFQSPPKCQQQWACHLSQLQHLQTHKPYLQGPRTRGAATPWTLVPLLGYRTHAVFYLQGSWDSPTF